MMKKGPKLDKNQNFIIKLFVIIKKKHQSIYGLFY